MAEITIPPLHLPEEPYGPGRFECYLDAGDVYLAGVATCVKAGGTNPQIQACINAAHTTYLATLEICDVQFV